MEFKHKKERHQNDVFFAVDKNVVTASIGNSKSVYRIKHLKQKKTQFI